MFGNIDKVLSFGKKVEMRPVDLLDRMAALGGVENDILQKYVVNQDRIIQQSELVGGGMTTQDRQLLDRLVRETLSQLSEHGTDATIDELQAFVERS
jgi:hypothetical protein